MNPISVTYTTTGRQQAIALDWRIAPFVVGYAIIYNGSTGSLTVDRSYDDLTQPGAAGTTTWFPSSAITTTSEGTMSAPCQFISVNIGSLSGGTVTLKLLQGANIN